MTTPRTYVDYLRDMLDAIDKVEQFIAGVDYAAFEANPEKIFAVVRGLEIIGEAASHLPRSLRTKYTEIEWADVIGMRVILAHRYFGVDLAVIWRTANESLWPLRTGIEQILVDLESKS